MHRRALLPTPDRLASKVRLLRQAAASLPAAEGRYGGDRRRRDRSEGVRGEQGQRPLQEAAI